MQGMIAQTYLVHGYPRDDPNRPICMLVDAFHDPFRVAKIITDDVFCFTGFEAIDAAVPDDCKGVIFSSEQEMFKRVPALAAWYEQLDDMCAAQIRWRQ